MSASDFGSMVAVRLGLWWAAACRAANLGTCRITTARDGHWRTCSACTAAGCAALRFPGTPGVPAWSSTWWAGTEQRGADAAALPAWPDAEQRQGGAQCQPDDCRAPRQTREPRCPRRGDCVQALGLIVRRRGWRVADCDLPDGGGAVGCGMHDPARQGVLDEDLEIGGKILRAARLITNEPPRRWLVNERLRDTVLSTAASPGSARMISVTVAPGRQRR